MRHAWQKKQIAAVLSATVPEKTYHIALSPQQLQAKSAIVYDAVTGAVLYAKDADTPRPLASVTKLMTALVAHDTFGPQTRIVISPQALQIEGDSGLKSGDIWTLHELSDFMLTVSSNDAASAIASARGNRQQFIATMNAFAQRLGLQSLRFESESGLDSDNMRASAWGSARDIAYLLTYITFTHPALLEATTFSRFTALSTTGERYPAVNTNKIVNQIPGIMGSKTGFTDSAGGNLAVIFDTDMGHPIAVVVLGSTQDGRFADVLQLVNAVIQ